MNTSTPREPTLGSIGTRDGTGSGDHDSAYRRLAIAILELDVAMLAARLADERTAENSTRAIVRDIRFGETAAEALLTAMTAV